MRIDIFSIFPTLIEEFARHSLLGRAIDEGVLDLRVHDFRDRASGKHRSVDDTPFGGGPGMVLRPEPIARTVREVEPPRPLLALTPSGRHFDQKLAAELATTAGFALLCGRYEGFDQRILDDVVDGELSIGDYVLGGGEAAALVVVESVTRLVPGVMGNESSALEESFAGGLLEYPQYTRPATFEGSDVPEALRSGDHARIAAWRRVQSLALTIRRRPDLIEARGGLTREEQDLLREFDL
jgi:tRNA (guanine37-N1)-methyltransferase